MFGSHLWTLPLLAQAADPNSSGQLWQYVPFVGFVIVFFFLTVRGQQAEARKRKDMLGGLKRNDKVLTTAGMYGTIVALDPENDRVTLRISEEGNVRVAFARAGIVKVVESSDKK